MPHISIRTNILSIFIFLLVIVTSSLLISQYYFSKKVAIESTHKIFTIISENIGEHLLKEAKETEDILNTKSRHKDILQPITFNIFHPALKSLIQILQIKDSLHSIYFAQGVKKFYEIVDIDKQGFKYPKNAVWMVIIRIDDAEQDAFLDKNLHLISKKRFIKHYDLNSRLWYKKAINSKKIISTPPYQFSNFNEVGITYAKKLSAKDIVLGIDYTLKQLNSFLCLQKFQKNSEIFIFNKRGEILASSSSKFQDNNLTNRLLFAKSKSVINYHENRNLFYAISNPLGSSNVYLGIKIDASTLLKPYIENINYSFFIAFIILLMAVPLILLSTNSIIEPIKKLILENEKIKHRYFNKVRMIDTNIIEFEELSTSLVSMSSSIQKYQKSQEELLNSIIKVLAEAIDAKSPYTAGHCRRVPEIAKLLLDEVNADGDIFKEFSLTSDDALREFEIASWLHDCGKVTTPEYVVDKSSKLETIYNRIHEIRTRFEVLWRDAEIEYLKNSISKEALHVRQKELRDDFEFIAKCNLGGEFMSKESQERIRAIAKQNWLRHFDDKLGLAEVELLRYKDKKDEILPIKESLLSDKTHHLIKRENFDKEAYERDGFKQKVPEYLYNYGEIYNLCIAKGTLSHEERYKINEHVIMSIKMLEKIPFPDGLTKIPEYAGTHHETLIGTGYPRELKEDELSIPARIMAIADIFEALSASDRPYKRAKTVSESIKIMSFMAKDRHIDENLFKLFLRRGVYKTYAQKYLKPQQIDEVDVKEYL